MSADNGVVNVMRHGHAHIGAPWGKTPSGIPVFNVASALLQRHIHKPYRIWTAEAPERRQPQTQERRELADGRDRTDGPRSERPHRSR
jgi:hypothetical protein